VQAIGGVALVIVAALLLSIVATAGNSSSEPARSPAPSGVVDKVTSIPAAVFNTVGSGAVNTMPKKFDAPALTESGKPLVLYIGAEYCPFCAAERWPTVIALSRFGSFANLQLTKSSSDDVFANTNTFSFHGATYQSKYITFQALELQTRTGQPLDTPTTEQARIYETYDAPPYTSKAGTIPFIDLGGRYLVGNASYDPNVLAGKSADQIANALADPRTDTSQAVVGAANTLTAAICTLTKNQPANVCDGPTLAKIQAQLR
jgi:uncharacterized protein DUF929